MDSVDESDDSSCPSLIDFSEKRSLPISIPDTQNIETEAQKFTVSCIEKMLKVLKNLKKHPTSSHFASLYPTSQMFHIHIAGRHLCSRRYSDFYRLHQALKRDFPDFDFPKFPGKKFFQLSEQQLDARRRGLECYLEKGEPAVASSKTQCDSNALYHNSVCYSCIG